MINASSLFEIPEEVTYLNCAAMSPQMKAVTAAGAQASKQKEAPWTISADDWFSHAEDLRGLAGRLMGSDADGVALVPAVSYGMAVAAANLPVRKGQNIVTLRDQFPSNVYAWRDLASRSDATVRIVEKSAADAWTDAVVAAIDDDTGVVAVPNCHWTDGALVDLVAVGARARSVGATLAVDASQSFCAYPMDVREVQPDFLVSVGYKWQLGPYGLGYMYVAPQWRDTGAPLEESWLTRRGAEDFESLVNYTDGYREGARRFDMGGFPQFVLAPMARAALTQIHEWSVANVQASISRLTSRIASAAEELGCSVLASTNRVGHIVGLRLPGGIPDVLMKRLSEERIHVSIRGDSLRIAPHLYNDEADCDRLIAVMRTTLET